jgi:site-specific recombinase XerD
VKHFRSIDAFEETLMTPLRQKLIDDITVRGLSENTQISYVQSVMGLARHYRRSPDQLSPQEVQDYLLYLLKERGLSPISCNTVRYGLRFFYRITLGRPDPHLFVPGAKQPLTLPEVLSQEEVVRLFTVTTNRKHRALLMATYAAGLRVSEVTRLRVTDIDSQRRCLRIQQGKGQKDRYVPLSERLLHELRAYWHRYRPAPWLFPGQFADRPITRDGASDAFVKAKRKAGITKSGAIHLLRHSWATHMLEAGTDLIDIQRLMGHRSPRATLRYLHIAQDRKPATPSPLDLLDFPASVRH